MQDDMHSSDGGALTIMALHNLSRSLSHALFLSPSRCLCVCARVQFTLPPVDIEAAESDVWSGLRAGKMEYTAALDALAEARDTGVQLSTRSMNLLALTNRAEQDAFITSSKPLPLVQLTVATCMETLCKNMQGERAISSLVVGTESRHVLIMEPSGTGVLKKFLLPSVPVFLAVQGTLDVEYRIVIAARNGNIYQIKKGKVLGTVIELETQPCGLVLLEKSLLVGCMDQIIHSFHFKGKKNYSIYLPEPISNMELLKLTRLKSQRALIVSLSNGEIRLYNKKHLIHTLFPNGATGLYGESITAMRFGPYGREEASLALCYKSGALTIKMLQRQADLEVQSTVPGPPPEQDIPLNVPKKTKLYVEQTQRERDQAIGQ
jgi:Bardet-Biedl syndrome 1 protein